jgi:hypothetical protein
MAGTVVIPWYATGFRADPFERSLNEIAAIALRYGASSYAVFRARDDRYKFQQFTTFADHLDWERYWNGPEMIEFRVRHSGWFQVPVLYGWWDLAAAGAVADRPDGSGNGRDGAGGARVVEGESA